MLQATNISEVLSSIVGEKHVLTGSTISADFSHDEFANGTFHSPEVVAEPETAEEISAILRACNKFGVAVTVRGAGTGKAGGSVPLAGGVVLSTKRMNKILSIDESACTMTVQPGVLLQEIKSAAAARRLYYPPDPGELTATIGGNASTNASGPCALKYGSTGDYIIDALVILADGSCARLSDRPELKSVIGSEGIIGVIGELTLRLVKKPNCDTVLLLPFADINSCVKAALSIMAADFSPSILEYLDTDIVEFSGMVTGNPVFPIEMDGERVGATLMLSIEGESYDELDEKMEALAELAEELECLDILVVDTPTLKRDVWSAHDAFHTSMEAGAKCSGEVNLTIPSEHIAEFVLYAKQLGNSSGLKVMAYSHVGSGGLHIHTVSSETKDEFYPKMTEFSLALYEKCSQLGGDPAGEYGIGYAKLGLNAGSERYTEIELLKTALDPYGILNPGKVVKHNA